MNSRRRAANGSGSIFKRKDGRWCAAFYITEADGRRVRQRFYGRSRGEVEAKLVEVRAKADSGAPMPPSQLTLQAFLREWLDQIVSKRVRANTLAAYRFNAESYLIPELGAKRLKKLTAREVRLYLADLERRGVGARTIRYVHATLRAALEDAVREELLEKNVAKLVRAPSVPRAERHPLTVDDLQILFRANEGHRLRAMLEVIALLGLRRSEVLGLRWSDVDLVAGTMQIRHGLHRTGGSLQLMPTKTARSRRTIPLPGVVVRELARAPRSAGDGARGAGKQLAGLGLRVHDSDRHPDRSGQLLEDREGRGEGGWAEGCADARLPARRRVRAARDWGCPRGRSMEIAGHSGLEMTMNVYAHVTLDDKRAALARFERLLEDGVEMRSMVSATGVSAADRRSGRRRICGRGNAKPQVIRG